MNAATRTPIKERTANHLTLEAASAPTITSAPPARTVNQPISFTAMESDTNSSADCSAAFSDFKFVRSLFIVNKVITAESKPATAITYAIEEVTGIRVKIATDVVKSIPSTVATAVTIPIPSL